MDLVGEGWGVIPHPPDTPVIPAVTSGFATAFDINIESFEVFTMFGSVNNRKRFIFINTFNSILVVCSTCK